MRYLPVTSSMFGSAFNTARDLSSQIADATSPFDPGVTNGSVFCLAVDARSGFVVRPDGELVYVFSLDKGNGAEIVTTAVSTGAVYLDCFDGYLPTLYGRHGFEVVSRVANWTPGGPDVVYMSLPGYADRHGY